jgi:hypothetical protein
VSADLRELELYWFSVPWFCDPLVLSTHFDFRQQGELVREIGEDPLQCFLRFWPQRLVTEMFEPWHARLKSIDGITALDEPLFFSFVAAKLLHGVTGIPNVKTL